jgi:hypothetical protein
MWGRLLAAGASEVPARLQRAEQAGELSIYF